MPEQTFSEQVSEASDLLSQPNGYTCQSACIAMATGRTDVMDIRDQLESIGDPGDPLTMGVLLTAEFGDRYIFDNNACLSEIRDWLKAGEFLIAHGWFTESGHVICLDGVAIDSAKMSYKISVKDPWSEFDFRIWTYNNPLINRYDGYYSSYGLYAAIVAGQSVWDAASIYRRGELDSMRKGAWIHRVKPAKKAMTPAAPLNQGLLEMLSGGSNSPIAIAVGTAEGTRTPDGRFTAAYNGHIDPGNGAHNQGSFSYQGVADNPKKADELQLAKLKGRVLPAFEKMWNFERTDPEKRALFAIACDVFTQSETACLGKGGFLEQMQIGLSGKFVQLAQEINRWRYLSYFDPETDRLDAPGFGNDSARLGQDQERRTEAVLRAIA
jgi:hypothetical protein